MKIEVSEQTIDEALTALLGDAAEKRQWAERSTAEDVREQWIDWYFEAELARRELSRARACAGYQELIGKRPPANYLQSRLPSAIDVELERHRRFGIPPAPDSHCRGLGDVAGALRVISLEAMAA